MQTLTSCKLSLAFVLLRRTACSLNSITRKYQADACTRFAGAKQFARYKVPKKQMPAHSAVACFFVAPYTL